MLDFLGRLAHRGRWWIVLTAGVIAVIAGAWGQGAFDHLTGSGFAYAGSDSSRVADLRRKIGGAAEADVVVVFHSDRWTVEQPDFQRAATAVLADLPRRRVTAVTDWWSSRSPAMLSNDRHTTFASIQVAGDNDVQRADSYDALADRSRSSVLQVTVGGPLPLYREVNEISRGDLERAELLALPALLVLLVFAFRNLYAAMLPVVVGVLAIVGSLAALRTLTLVMDVSVFAVNVVTLLGLGLAVDYSLFVVNRFREELDRGSPVPEALRRTMNTAGRTIVVSAVTVALALSGLLVFPQTVLRSIAFGGIAAVLLAVLFSATVMPALLALLGRRVSPWGRRSGRPAADSSPGRWERLARGVMRRPVLVTVGVLLVLGTLGTPFLHVQYGWLDTRVLPQSAHSRQAQQTLDQDFPTNVTNPVAVAVTLPDQATSPAGARALDDYLARLRAVPSVLDVAVTGARGDRAKVDVRFGGQAISTDGRRVVEAVRAVAPPAGGQALVGGNSAIFTDLLDMLRDRLPYTVLVLVLSTFVVLFLAFGSFVLPVNALLMNVVTLMAPFGAVVWIFQDGNWSGLLDFTPTGTIDVVQLVLILTVAFALSMDYQVFVLSRIREQYDRTGDTRTAVATGLQRSAGLVTTAALLLVVVIGAFATSQVLIVKIIGVGLAVAIVLDAVMVRSLLVPATMRLLGPANWWAPRFARPVFVRWAIREGEPEPDPRAVANRSKSSP